MSGYPSMTALLGLLAVAGFQNRDKLAELLGGGQGSAGAPGQGGGLGRADHSGQGGGQGTAGASGQAGGLGGLLGQLTGSLGGASAGSVLSGGLGELVDRFKQSGHGDVADSWVGTGPNRDIAPPQLERAIGPDVLATLAQQTGLSREEILSRLSRDLPQAVDRYTPDGRLPTESAGGRF